MFLLARDFTLQQQKGSAETHAQFVTELVLADGLRASDFSSLSPKRRSALDRLFRGHALLDSVVGATLYGDDGRIAYSSDRALVRTADGLAAKVGRAEARDAVGSAVETARVGGRSQKLFAVVVPVGLDGAQRRGALVLWSDYGTIERATNRALVPIAVVLALVLLALFAGLVPVLHRATRQIRSRLGDSEFDALHDGLTGLPNRRLLEDRLQLALDGADRDGRPVAVMLLDLNGFKQVNDTLGHAAGDELLREVAGRLESVLRGADTVARLGGDEFAVALSGVEPGEARQTADRIHEALAQPVSIDGLAVSVGASVGIALHPRHGDTVSTLLRHADVAMYEAKRAGRPYVLYDAASDPNDAARLALTADLHAAIERDELILHYQPTMDLRTGEVAGVEALLRWQHPTLGLLEAERFMSLAEQSGVAAKISEIAIEAAIRQSAEWSMLGMELAVAVNLDVRNLVDLEFPARIAALLDLYGVDAERIELEITETSIMSDPGRVRRVALELAEIGFRLTIDDFGTGYSSLSYLAQLPLSKLKIDRSFVGRMIESPRERTIVHATIELAHSLGLETVAEGVEDAATLELLVELGSDVAQGYHIGLPVDADSFFPLVPDSVAA